MRILLDTNAYSDWRRAGRWNDIIAAATEVLVPVVVLGELRFGFRGSAREQENEGKLQAFLREPVVRVVPVDEPASHGYAALKEHLRAAGQPIPENDIWIAALAVQHHATLVTSDAHFGHLPQVARAVE